MISSAMINPDVAPATQEQLWALAHVFLANWDRAVSVRSAFDTSVNSAESSLETRAGHQGKARREVEVELAGFKEEDLQALKQAAMRAGSARFLFPLYSDHTSIQNAIWFTFNGDSSGISCQVVDGSGDVISGASPNMKSSGELLVDVTGTTSINFSSMSASNAGIIVTGLTDPPVASVISGTIPTIRMPSHYVLYRGTGNFNNSKSCGLRIEGTGGSPVFVIPGGSGAGLTVASLPLTSRALGSAITVSEMVANGWVTNNVARLRVHSFSIGSASVSVQMQGRVTPRADSTNRRFFAGQRVAICEMQAGETRAKRFEIATIGTVDAGFLAFSTGLTQPYSKGARVYPLIEAEIDFDRSFSARADNKVFAKIVATEGVGLGQLPCMTTPNQIVISASPDGYDVLDVPPGWGTITQGTTRQSRSSKSGIEEIHLGKGARPMQTASISYVARDRARAFTLVKFFEARRGRLYPFILPLPTSEMRPSVIDATHITVAPVGYTIDWTFFPFVAVLYRSGAWAVRRILSVSDNVLTLDAGLPGTDVTQVRRISLGMLARFSSDQMTERWHTDRMMDTTLDFVEVLDPQGVSLGVPALPSPVTRPPSRPSSPGGGGGGGGGGDGCVKPVVDCDGNPTGEFIPCSDASTSADTYLYNPDDGNSRTAFLNSPALLAMPPGGILITGFQRLPFAPGNAGNPDYDTSCDGDPPPPPPPPPDDDPTGNCNDLTAEELAALPDVLTISPGSGTADCLCIYNADESGESYNPWAGKCYRYGAASWVGDVGTNNYDNEFAGKLILGAGLSCTEDGWYAYIDWWYAGNVGGCSAGTDEYFKSGKNPRGSYALVEPSSCAADGGTMTTLSVG